MRASLWRIGLLAIAVFGAAAQHRAIGGIGSPSRPFNPVKPTQPIHSPNPVQPGFGIARGAFRPHAPSNVMVGVVPYLVPVPVESEGEESSPSEDPASLETAPPPVQPYLPAPIVEAAPAPDRTCAPVVQEDPVHFFIVLKDGTVNVAVAYWIIEGTLHYLSLEGSHNQVSLALINRALSARMNAKGRIPFILPD